MKLKPTKQQMEFLEWEFGVFFHFGIRSFNPGRRDWDGVEMPPETFNPPQLDCEQWIRTARDAGANYAILTTKHHDGFALWPSRYSRYSVADTPWRNGKGDVVREFVDACRKYDLKVGLYYSPAQWGSRSIPFESAKEYDDYFISQIGELLTNYGKIDYLWFDGCGSEGHEFDRKRIVNEIFRMQPGILTFCDPEWTPCIRWIGNEDGFASLDNPLVVSKTDFSMLATEVQTLSQASFLPSECDCKIRATWFYDNNLHTLKGLEELFGMYEMSVGHGSNFLLNVGPDNRGLLPEEDSRRLLELGEKIRQNYRKPLPYTKPEKNGDVYTITFADEAAFGMYGTEQDPISNCVVLQEDISEGQSITAFRIYAYLPGYKTRKIQVFEGKTIGHKVFCKFAAIRAHRYELEITGHDGDYTIREMKAYYVK